MVPQKEFYKLQELEKVPPSIASPTSDTDIANLNSSPTARPKIERHHFNVSKRRSPRTSERQSSKIRQDRYYEVRFLLASFRLHEGLMFVIVMRLGIVFIGAFLVMLGLD